MERPLVGCNLPQAVQRQIAAFADADSCSPDEPERIRVEIIGSEQFLLEELILLRGERSGQIAWLGREVFSANEIGWKGVAVGGQIVQQSAETNEVIIARVVAPGRLLFTEPAEPTEQMRIAAQFGEPAKLGEGGAEISEEVARRSSILLYGAGAEREGERLD